MTIQTNISTATATEFVNVIDGCAWDDGIASHVFPLMCPDTGRNCHSACACYLDSRTSPGALTCTVTDMAYRVDGYTSGKCLKYGVRLESKAD